MSLHETSPKIERCSKCLQMVLRCWAEGFLTTVDPIALSLVGQLEALEADLWLYEIHLPRIGKLGAYLVTRDELRIKSGKPHIALAEHRCDFSLVEHVDKEGQVTLDVWLYPATPKAESIIPPF